MAKGESPMAVKPPRDPQDVGYTLPTLLAIGVHLIVIAFTLIRLPSTPAEPDSSSIVQATFVSTETFTDQAQHPRLDVGDRVVQPHRRLRAARAGAAPRRLSRPHATRTRGTAGARITSLSPHTIASARSGDRPGPSYPPPVTSPHSSSSSAGNAPT